MKAPADPEIRELVMILSDLAAQNLHEDKGGWFSDGFCNANTDAIDVLVGYGLWELHPDCKRNDSGLAGKWRGWSDAAL